VEPEAGAGVEGGAARIRPFEAPFVGGIDDEGAGTREMPPTVPGVVAAPTVPGVAETITGALDLALAASRSIRRASLYVGLVMLALAGPAVVAFLALVRQLGGLEETLMLISGQQPTVAASTMEALPWLGIAAGLASIGVVTIVFEGQILAVAILGAASTGRSMGLRSAIRLSRRVFWIVAGAAFLVGILERSATFATEAILGGVTRSPGLVATLVILAGAVVTVPFGYYQSGVILGDVGATEALKRSTWITRARWRLAILVASAGVVVSFIEFLALGAGLDLVARIAVTAGLGFDGSLPIVLVSGALVLAVVVAIGSLLVTIAALVSAPQVFVFLRMTGYSGGLDRADPTSATARPPRLLAIPMLVVICLAALAALATLAALPAS
jgi:hypothetical protein